MGLNAQQTYDNEKVKSEVKTILSDYQSTINAFINLPENDKSRRAYSKKLKENFESTAIWVFNNLDSNSFDTSYIKIFEYIKLLPKHMPLGSQVKLELANCKIEDVKGNNERNGYTIKAHVKQWVESKSIVEREKSLLELNINDKSTLSSQIDLDTIQYDTIIIKRSERLTFHFKLDYFGYTYKGPKVSAITKWKIAPKYRKLKKEEQWWVDLTPEWKAIFKENAKLQEFPDKMDLQKISYIYNFDMKGKNITSVKPLSKVSQLRKLDLTGNPISSLEGLGNCKFLAELYINETQIKSLEPLNKLSSLQILHCKKLELKSLRGIENLLNLIELDCSENLLINIDPLKKMNLLEVLNISLNQDIESIEPLKNKPNLTKLWMKKMKVTDISAISTCGNMTILDVYSNEIGSLAPIARLRKLAYLDCSFAKITSLQPLSGHKMLVHFYCEGNGIKEITVTRNFYALKYLKIGRTSVESLSPIMKLEYLQRIDIFETKITVAEKNKFKKKHPKCKILYY